MSNHKLSALSYLMSVVDVDEYLDSADMYLEQKEQVSSYVHEHFDELRAVVNEASDEFYEMLSNEVMRGAGDIVDYVRAHRL